MGVFVTTTSLWRPYSSLSFSAPSFFAVRTSPYFFCWWHFLVLSSSRTHALFAVTARSPSQWQCSVCNNGKIILRAPDSSGASGHHFFDVLLSYVPEVGSFPARVLLWESFIFLVTDRRADGLKSLFSAKKQNEPKEREGWAWTRVQRC